MGLLSTRVGVCLYLLLPNHWVQRLLTERERARIDEGNRLHNTVRPDYADPSRYRGGQSFDHFIADPMDERRRRQLMAFLDRVKPSRVLEIGPGSGCHTRTIVEHPAVKRYVAADINPAFLAYLQPRLEAAATRRSFSFALIEGSAGEVPSDDRFDAIILMSAVHHISNRAALLRELSLRLAPNGRLLAIDPTHYLLRWWHLSKKLGRRGYAKQVLQAAREGHLSTHAMCQWSEYRRVARRAGLDITQVSFDDRPRFIECLRALAFPLGPLNRWTAQEIAIECRRARPSYLPPHYGTEHHAIPQSTSS